MTDLPMFSAGRYAAVVRALEGVRNRQALTVMLAGFLLVAILIGLGSGLAAWAGSPLLAVVVNLLAAILAASIVNAAGLALMDAARDQSERGFIQLIARGGSCFARFLAIVVLALVSFGLYLLLAAALLWLCKLPFLGPVLLTILVPALVLGAALLLLVLTVAVSMLAPSLWAGNSIRAAVRELLDIAGHRPLEVLVSMILLGILIGLIGSVASLFILAGSTTVGGLAAGILAAPMGELGGLDGSALPIPNPALAVAGSIGFMLVFALLSGVLGVIQMNGLCHIYLQAREAIATAGGGATPDDQPKRRRVQVVAAAPDPWEELPTTQAPSSAEPAAVASGDHCPACAAVIGAEDRFCGECGQRLGAAEPPTETGT
ncbi:MAG: zinc ribbon domain-containing protein [Rhodocyclaceae bacterium]|nr:zinc ribbon domain-containing protein [Rhodocyclaceae bacterium]